MLTPQDFREKTFEKAFFGGYDMGAVDDFLDEAANDYSALAKENMVLKNKMKVLVDKIEEYRATEDAMRLTLLSAQKLSTQIEEEAKAKAQSEFEESRKEAERITREAYTLRATEEARLYEAKRSSTEYIENMRALCQKQSEFLSSLEAYKLQEGEAFPAAQTPVEPAAPALGVTEEIKKVVSETDKTPDSGADEPTRLFTNTDAAPPQQGGQFGFDNIRFGK